MKAKAISHFNTRDIVYIGVFTAFQCLISGFSIPIGPISITLATFGIYLIGAVFSPHIAFFVVLNYIILGAIGLPVFSNFNAGLAVLTGVTGGYIVGYIPLILIEGILIWKFPDKKWMYPLSMILGTLVLYLCGSIQFMIVSGFSKSFSDILKICVYPFVLVDLVKIIVAYLLSQRLRPLIHKLS